MPITTPLLSYLQNPEKTLPMLAIEVPTTLGRTYQGYKRGGKTEARERICEETTGAVVWLFGAKAFNKGFDFIGKNILGLKDLDIDVGKDSLRNPSSYITHKPAATAAFKFSKIMASSLLGVLAMGLVVPKIKQAMTNAFRMKDGMEPIPDKKSKDGKFHPNWADKFVSHFIKYDSNEINQKNKTNLSGSQKTMAEEKPEVEKPAAQGLKLSDGAFSMDDFVQNVRGQNSPAFTGGNIQNALCYASYNLENNTAWRLLSTDVGTLTGRVATSRNKKEKIEYLVRDSISSLFYVFAAPLFSSFLRKATNTPDVNPRGSEAVAKRLKEVISNQDSPVKADFFTSKIPSKEEAKELVKNIKFREDGTIWLDDFNAQTNYAWMGHAQAMSELQPKLADGKGNYRSILSEKQAVDILSDSVTSEPVFLKNAISDVTNGKSNDPKAFVSRKKLEKIRDSFDDFLSGLKRYAKDKEIDASLIDKYTKKLNRTNLAIHLAGMAFAVMGLAVLIPKFQYLVSEKLTGEKEFPGNLSYDNSKNSQSANK